MKDSFRFFSNKVCEYYPCHKDCAELNCLFCFCPFYREESCPGNPVYITSGDRKIRDCSGCLFPHKPESYDIIIKWMTGKNR